MISKIPERLKELRQKNGYSQDELAGKILVTRQAISKWERGEALPDTENLIALADVYGISIDELLGHTPTAKKEAQDGEDDVTSPSVSFNFEYTDGKDFLRPSISYFSDRYIFAYRIYMGCMGLVVDHICYNSAVLQHS